MKFTASDERRLQILQERKQKADAEKFAKVEAVVGGHFFNGCRVDDVVRGLVESADAAVEALAPFCKKSEIHKSRRKS
jgi:hypothetical protein